jgi:segregation and condensation protein B
MDNNQEQLKDVAKKIEVVLFYLNDSVTIKELASYLDLDRDIILGAIPVLKQDLVDRPITLVLNGEEVSIGTKPEFSGIIEKIMKEEMEKDLTQASLDTLSIILYKSPITKKEIEYIRGVNSSFSIRNLSQLEDL